MSPRGVRVLLLKGARGFRAFGQTARPLSWLSTPSLVDVKGSGLLLSFLARPFAKDHQTFVLKS